MERTRNPYVFVYNLGQAQFFLDHGLCPVAVGKGSYGDVFLKFKRDEATEEVFQLWQEQMGRIQQKKG